LDSRQGGVDVAHQLVDEASDVLAPALDAKVPHSLSEILMFFPSL
jgi:hypothetical protein